MELTANTFRFLPYRCMKYTTFQDLTVGQYQELYRIHTSKDDDLDKVIQSVAILTGTTPKQVEEMTLPQFNLVSLELALIFSGEPVKTKPPRYLKLNGKKYAVEYNVRKLNAGQYIEIQAWIKDGKMIENMHKVIASLIYPVSWWSKGKNDSAEHEVNSELILDCNYLQVQGICVFFSLLWNASIKALVPYLKKGVLKKVTTNQKEVTEALEMVLDGSLMQDKLQPMKESV